MHYPKSTMLTVVQEHRLTQFQGFESTAWGATTIQRKWDFVQLQNSQQDFIS